MYYYYRNTIVFSIALVCALVPSLSFASTSDGTINSTNKYAWSEKLGWINFGTTEGNVHVTDTQLTGYVWSESTGWITLNPTGSVYVTNNAEGTLGGYAWGEGVGYIAFTGVTVDSSGYFHGYATSTLSGQISFNCLNGSSCASSDFKVQTDWRPASTRSSGSVSTASSGGNGPVVGNNIVFNAPHMITPQFASTSNQCPVYLTKYIRVGKNNDVDEVKKLQRFLKTYENNLNLAETGLYDDPTYQAVIMFQQKYADHVLGPWSKKKPTGYVYRTTLKKINEIYCKGSTPPEVPVSTLIPTKTSSTTCPYFTKRLILNSQNSQEVSKVQDFLKAQGFLDINYVNQTTIDKQTVNAIKAFQIKYSTDILSDGTALPTGYWLGSSIKKANEIIGCK